jgi:hypothetical protein
MSEMVFAYGSNMCSGRFRAYGLEPIGHGRAVLLDGYRLDFSKRSKDGSGNSGPGITGTPIRRFSTNSVPT